MTLSRWPGESDPRSLAGTRLELHHVAIIASALGRSLAPRKPGFAHAALTWDAGLGALAGSPVQLAEDRTVRAALAFDPPRLLLVGDGSRRSAAAATSATVPLGGATIAGLWERIRAAIADARGSAGGLSYRTPADLPMGPMQDGRPLAPDAVAAAELGRWFAFADDLLSAEAAAHGIPLPVPCWPDHFDMAVVARLDGPDQPPDAQVTLGFSPGDHTIPEPYLYVTPWPIPPSSVAQVSAPAGGRWQVEGWVGLAFPATAMLAAADPRADAAAFLERGFAIARDLVSAG